MPKVATFPIDSPKGYCHTNVNIYPEDIRKIILRIRDQLAREDKKPEEQITLTRIIHSTCNSRNRSGSRKRHSSDAEITLPRWMGRV